jgi:O-antigen/teichoic acid export membrane protein
VVAVDASGAEQAGPDPPRRTATGSHRTSQATLWKRPRQIAGRLSWGLADQAVSSLTNAAVSIYAARSLAATQFGAFSLAYVTYAFALNASRGLATDPLMVRFSGTDVPTWRRAVAECTGTAAAVGLAGGAIVLGVAALFSGTTRLAFLALGLTLPGLMLQDSWRYSFFALGRGSGAFLNDLIWALAMVPGLLILRATHHQHVFWFVLVWGAAATVAALAGPLQARVIPRLTATRSWVWSHRDLGPRYLAENTANSASSQLRLYGVGVILGLAAVGYVQAAFTLMGPFMVIFMGFSLVTVPEAARILRRSPRHLRLFCLLVGGGLAAAALGWGAALLVALPRGFGQWLLGPIWRPAYPLVLPLTVALAGACAVAGASAGLRGLGASRRSLRSQVIASVLYVVLGLAGAVVGGVVGTVQATALAVWLGALVWWWQLHVAMRESGYFPAGRRLWRRRSGRAQRAIPMPVRMPPSDLDVTLPLRVIPELAASVPSSTIWNIPPVRPERAKVPASAKAVFAASAAVLVAASATAGWMLTHRAPARTHVATSGLAPHASSAPTHTSAPTPASPVPSVRALKPVGATVFDPYGDGQGENNSLVPLAIDASRATSWHTQWYATARFGNLKPGTGLLVDMGRAVTITSVRVLLGSASGADFQLRAGDTSSSLAGLRPVARAADVGGTVRLRLATPAHARYLLIWFTKLPPDTSGTFQADVYDVKVAGRR